MFLEHSALVVPALAFSDNDARPCCAGIGDPPLFCRVGGVDVTTGTLQAGGAKEVPTEAAPAKAVPPEKAEAGVMDTSRMCFPVFPMLSRGLVSHVVRLDWSPSCLKVRLVELISQTQDRRSGKLQAHYPRHAGVCAQNSSSFEPCINVRFCFAVSVQRWP